jgi:hypothetical protein
MRSDVTATRPSVALHAMRMLLDPLPGQISLANMVGVLHHSVRGARVTDAQHSRMLYSI